MKSLLTHQMLQLSDEYISVYTTNNRNMFSLSVVMPAYNEEEVIACTVSDILNVLSGWMKDFEVIVVNDGSTDQTASIVAAMSEKDPHVHLITHSVNRGYGAATKEQTIYCFSFLLFES